MQRPGNTKKTNVRDHRTEIPRFQRFQGPLTDKRLHGGGGCVCFHSGRRRHGRPEKRRNIRMSGCRRDDTKKQYTCISGETPGPVHRGWGKSICGSRTRQTYAVGHGNKDVNLI